MLKQIRARIGKIRIQ